MKKLSTLIVIIFVMLSGCNLIIDFIDSGNDLLPADIFILDDISVIPHNGSYEYAMGDAISGTKKSIEFTVENRGEKDLHLYTDPRVQLDGSPEFSLKQDVDGFIVPGGTSHFSISFEPAEVGLYQASISVESNDARKTPYTFTITGNCTEEETAIISIRYGSQVIENNDILNIGDVKIGSRKNVVFHLKNLGTKNLKLERDQNNDNKYIGVKGDGFSLTKDVESPVEPDSIFTFHIKLKPDNETRYQGIIIIRKIIDVSNETGDREIEEFRYTLEANGIK